VKEQRVELSSLIAAVEASVRPEMMSPSETRRLQRTFGYTREELAMIVAPMGATGEEPIGSMGNDTPLAVLSDESQLLFSYFRQQFAQVTNPPIDPIREQLVMSLRTWLGPQGNLLDHAPERAHHIQVDHPILTAPGIA